MLYNPISKQLFSDSGSFIKQLYCPLQRRWEELETGQNDSDHARLPIPLKGRLCKSCSKAVIDSNLIKENELIDLIKNDPHICIKIDLNQENIYLTHQTYVEHKQPK